MPNLKDKESRARSKFIGKKVRQRFDQGPYLTCENVVAYGPPSGWYVAYELSLAKKGRILVTRLSDVEIQTNPSSRRQE